MAALLQKLNSCDGHRSSLTFKSCHRRRWRSHHHRRRRDLISQMLRASRLHDRFLDIQKDVRHQKNWIGGELFGWLIIGQDFVGEIKWRSTWTRLWWWRTVLAYVIGTQRSV